MAENRMPMRLLTQPVPITFPERENGKRVHTRKVSAGRAHTIVITDHGTVYGLGESVFEIVTSPMNR